MIKAIQVLAVLLALLIFGPPWLMWVGIGAWMDRRDKRRALSPITLHQRGTEIG